MYSITPDQRELLGSLARSAALPDEAKTALNSIIQSSTRDELVKSLPDGTHIEFTVQRKIGQDIRYAGVKLENYICGVRLNSECRGIYDSFSFEDESWNSVVNVLRVTADQTDTNQTTDTSDDGLTRHRYKGIDVYILHDQTEVTRYVQMGNFSALQMIYDRDGDEARPCDYAYNDVWDTADWLPWMVSVDGTSLPPDYNSAEVSDFIKEHSEGVTRDE